MKESKFIDEFYKMAIDSFPEKYIVKKKQNLLYELYLTRQLEINKKINIKSPKRGTSAFQTDLIICEKISDELQFPRVVIEFKTNISTHDVITYSAKAGMHKSIYPALRYGLLAESLTKIPGRFFIHNEHLDFFITTKKYKDKDLLKFVSDLVLSEIKTSKLLEEIAYEDPKYDYYRNEIILRDFSQDSK